MERYSYLVLRTFTSIAQPYDGVSILSKGLGAEMPTKIGIGLAAPTQVPAFAVRSTSGRHVWQNLLAWLMQFSTQVAPPPRPLSSAHHPGRSIPGQPLVDTACEPASTSSGTGLIADNECGGSLLSFVPAGAIGLGLSGWKLMVPLAKIFIAFPAACPQAL